jgi:hypothetical protein
MNAEAGVIESQPGIIESTQIDPLDPNRNIDEEFAASKTSALSEPASNPHSEGFGGSSASEGSPAPGMAKGALNMATGMTSAAAKMVYGAAVGDQDTLENGRRDWANSGSGTNK